MFSILIDPALANDIVKSGDNSVTGWGLALFISLSFNFLLWYELRALHSKFLEYLSDSDKTLQSFHNVLLNKLN